MTGKIRVAADTGPIHYLVLINVADILERLFGKVSIPGMVRNELAHAAAPKSVRDWMEHPPAWLEIWQPQGGHFDDASLQALDEGERATILLGASLDADLLLMDDREGVAVARSKGFAVTGTLGILDLAARRGLVDLADCFSRLKNTNFRYPPRLMDALLTQHKGKPD